MCKFDCQSQYGYKSFLYTSIIVAIGIVIRYLIIPESSGMKNGIKTVTDNHKIYNNDPTSITSSCFYAGSDLQCPSEYLVNSFTVSVNKNYLDTDRTNLYRPSSYSRVMNVDAIPF